MIRASPTSRRKPAPPAATATASSCSPPTAFGPFTANDNQTAIQQLGAGQSLTDSFTAVSSDGSASQLVTVTILGTNDVPVIGGVDIGSVTADVSVVSGHISTSGTLSIADVDQGRSNFTVQPGIVGNNGYGTFTLAANGSWTYTADNGQTEIQQLGAGQSLTDSFTAFSSDGTASHLVTILILGTNNIPVIGGVSTGAVTEDNGDGIIPGNLTSGGTLTIADVDQGQSSFAIQPITPGSNGYGFFTLAANGNWTYTANNSQTAIQQLGAGQSLTDSFTAVSSDGSASQHVTITITVPTTAGVLRSHRHRPSTVAEILDASNQDLAVITARWRFPIRTLATRSPHPSLAPR